MRSLVRGCAKFASAKQVQEILRVLVRVAWFKLQDPSRGGVFMIPGVCRFEVVGVNPGTKARKRKVFGKVVMVKARKPTHKVKISLDPSFHAPKHGVVISLTRSFQASLVASEHPPSWWQEAWAAKVSPSFPLGSYPELELAAAWAAFNKAEQGPAETGML